MAHARLDPKLMKKVAERLGLSKITQVNVKVSHKADRLGISSEAALIILAKELGIGTALFQRKQDPEIQAQIRASLPSLISQPTKPVAPAGKKAISEPKKQVNRSAIIKAAIEYVIQDEALRSRCEDLLLGKKHFDRAINQATLVLEERLRMTSKPTAKLVGEALVGYALSADFARTVLRVSNNQDEQRGITDIVRGIVPVFRNTTHHHLVDNFTREDALRVCGFVDVMLRVIDRSTKVR